MAESLDQPTPFPSRDVSADGGPIPAIPVILDDQRNRWRRGEPATVEDYLERFPSLGDDPEGLLDLIYNEVVLRDEHGQAASLDEYQARFPDLAAPLRDLFEIHGAIDNVSHQSTILDPDDVGSEVATVLPVEESSVEAVILEPADFTAESVALGSSEPPPPPLPLPTSPKDWPILDGYDVVDVLGRGGMGVVYRARDRNRGVDVAVKTMQRVDPGAIYRFKQEFRTLLDVSHPNLITLYELISDGRSWFIVMELLDAVDFLEYVRRGARPKGQLALAARPSAPDGSKGLGTDQRIRLRKALRQLAEGLTTLHQAGKLHRDIKPSNVLVARQGRVVVMDFGLAIEQEQGDSTEGQLVGTAGYMAPEQAAGQHLTQASDWYAVGVILYEALTGRLPFVGGSLQVLMDKQRLEPRPPRDLNADVPEDLNALCVDLLRRDPRKRPSGRDVLKRLGAAEDEAPEAISTIPGTELPFVGRESQRAAMTGALEALSGGGPVVVFVRGRSGVGKSALVQKFLDGLVASEDAVVLSGRCYERESVPYKALDSLIDALSRYLRRLPSHAVKEVLPRDVGPLARVFPVLRRVDAVASSPRRDVEIPDPHQLRRRAYAALRELLARLGDRQPLVLAIDDLQWGDSDSLAVLSEILRPPDPPAFLLLGCYRTEEASENAFLRALRDWAESESFDHRVLDVDPLSLAEARALATRLLGGQGPVVESQAEAIARESGGNPFFVAELVRAVQGAGGGDTPHSAGDPIALDEVLWSRVVRLPAEARELLEVVSVSGRPLQPSVAWQCLARDVGDERASLALLRSARLVRVAGSSSEGDQVETYHDRVRETVVAHLPPKTLTECHRRLAVALEATGRADPEVLGVHFQEAGILDRAGGHFAVAAAQAAEALAFDRAATLYRLAIDLRPQRPDAVEDNEPRRLRAELGQALENAGRGAEAANAYLSACQGSSVAEALELRRRAAMQFLISGHIDQGLEALRDVLRAVGMTLPRTPYRALASLLLRRGLLRLRGLGFRPRDTSQLSPADLTRIDVSWSAGIGLSNVDWIRGADFQTRGLLLALKAGEPLRIARALAVEAAQTSTSGPSVHQRTVRLLDTAATLAQQSGQPYAPGMVTLAVGVSSYLECRWRGALEACDESEAIFRDQCTGVAWELDTAHAYALWALSHLGLWDELSRRVPVLINEALERGDLYAAMNLSTYIMSIARLGADEPAAALEATGRVMSQWSQDGYHVQHNDLVWATVQIELYLGQGRSAWERIREHWPILSKSLLLRVQFIRVAMWGLRARCALSAASTGEGDPAPYLREASRAIARLDREPIPWAVAQSALARAGLASLQGRPDECVARLRAAASGFRAADMALCAAVAEHRLGNLLGGDEGLALRDQADAWMSTQSIRRPDHIASMFAPGFP